MGTQVFIFCMFTFIFFNFKATLYFQEICSFHYQKPKPNQKNKQTNKPLNNNNKNPIDICCLNNLTEQDLKTGLAG